MVARTKLQRFFYKTRNVLGQSTIHGFNIIGFPDIHPLERLLFIVIVIVATVFAQNLILSHWHRFSANPTVVTIEKDYRNWENPFPAVTGCFVEKTDDEKLEKFIYDKWNIEATDKKFDYYLNFTNAAANITLSKVDNILPFIQDESLQNIDILELVTKVHPTLSESLVFQNKKEDYWMLVMTELGLCFSFNSKFSRILATGIAGGNNSFGQYELGHCHYLNGICYARYDSDPKLPVKYYVHSYLDIIHTSSESPLIVRESEELEVNYRMIQTTSSPNIKYLSSKQRKCRFDDEPLTNDISVYSTTVCYVICRYKLVLDLCGCKPFFYSFLAGRKCTLKDFACFHKYAKELSKSAYDLNCNCPQPCDLITYLKEKEKNTKWEAGYFDQRITFRWGLLPPMTKYRRDILYGFGDLIVSLGGTLTLFLGVSFISIIELIFLIIEKICLE